MFRYKKTTTLDYCLRILLLPIKRRRALVNYVMSLAASGHQCKHPVDLTLTPFSHKSAKKGKGVNKALNLFQKQGIQL
jgi:hypothetical protein